MLLKLNMRHTVLNYTVNKKIHCTLEIIYHSDKMHSWLKVKQIAGTIGAGVSPSKNQLELALR